MTGPQRRRFRVGSDSGWLGVDRGTSSSRTSGLRLAAASDGPLSSTSTDGSLGGLLLPQGMALDESYRLFLLDRGGVVKAFDGTSRRFVPILRALSPSATSGREPAGRPTLTVVGGWLLVVDPASGSLWISDLRGPTPVSMELPPPPAMQPLQLQCPELESPLQVLDHAANRGAVDLLVRAGDGEHAVVRWRPPGPFGQPVGTCELQFRPSHSPQRIAACLGGALLLLVQTAGDDGPLLQVIEPGTGAVVASERDALRHGHRVDGPWIRADERGCFRVPASLARACNRRPSGKALYVDDPLGKDGRLSVPLLDLLFDADGEVLDADATSAPRQARLYAQEGRWLSQRFDSGIYRCSWGLLRVELWNLPAGTRIRVATACTDEPLADDESLSSAPAAGPNDDAVSDSRLWQQCLVITRADIGTVLRRTRWPVTIEGLAGGEHRLTGRYLWLRVEIEADGFRTPVIGALSVEAPSESYIDYLPAIYRQEHESRALLERLLAVPQVEWDRLEERLDGYVDHLDPARVPDGEPLRFLASWIGAPVELAATPSRQRRLLQATAATLHRRGSVAAIRALVAALVMPDAGTGDNPGADGGLDAESQRLPVVFESFRERWGIVLGDCGAEPRGDRLAAADPAGRFVLDRSRLDVDRLGSGITPEAGLFCRSGHFEVVVPEAWLEHAEDEGRLRRLIEREKPAHTTFALRRLVPGIRVGEKSRVGVDTLIGRVESVVVAAAEDRRGSRLGDGSVLTADPGYPLAFPVIRPIPDLP